MPTDPAAFRTVLGAFASGLVVVGASGPDGPLGMTCQSFCSLSLDPPLVLFCPAATSSTWPRVRAVGSFCLSILSEDQAGVSTRMSRSGTAKFAGVGWDRAPSGAPRLLGAVGWLDCSLRDEHEAGDHTVVVARVEAFGLDRERRPLLYHRGSYAHVAP
nr:flavin reductase family protein [Pseudonocardia sp. C8]